MTTYKSGHTVYAPNGATLIFDHIHKDTAYCYPVVVVQTTHAYQEGFEEHATEADHLIALPAACITAKPPVAALHRDIEALLTQKNAIKATIMEVTKSATLVKTLLRDMEARAEKYQNDHPMFNEIANLIDGTPMHPLIIHQLRAVGMDFKIVTQADTEKLDLITLSATNQGKFEWASNPESHRYNQHHKLKFFQTEEALQKYVKEQFVILLEVFYTQQDPGAPFNSNNPGKHTLSQVPYPGTPLNDSAPYRHILSQVKEFPFLEIPEKVTALVKVFEVAQHDKQLEAAKKRLVQLQGTPNV